MYYGQHPCTFTLILLCRVQLPRSSVYQSCHIGNWGLQGISKHLGGRGDHEVARLAYNIQQKDCRSHPSQLKTCKFHIHRPVHTLYIIQVATNPKLITLRMLALLPATTTL